MERQSTEIRQEQIKKAVLEILDTEGMNRLSTRHLAEKVGISEGAIFRHFKSKRDILVAVVEDVKSHMLEPLRAIALKNAPADERLRAFLKFHMQYLARNKGITLLLFSEAAHMNDPKLKSLLLGILSELKQFVSKIFQDGIVEGKWDPRIHTENVAMLYMGVPITLNIEAILSGEPLKHEDFCDRMYCLLNRVLEKR